MWAYGPLWITDGGSRLKGAPAHNEAPMSPVVADEAIVGPPFALDHPLRIGILAAPWVPIPPTAYGGSELVIDNLARGLERAGHQVELFTTADSECPVRRACLFDRADPDRMGATVLELRHVAAAYDHFADVGVDLVHDHTLAGLFHRGRPANLPVVTTCHGPFDADLSDLYRRSSPAVPLIAISRDQAGRAPEGIEIGAVIHHGIDVDRYPFSDRPDDQFLFLGRMDPTKGVAEAAQAANAQGTRLVIAAKMRRSAERRYFEEQVLPHLNDRVTFIGEADVATKIDLLRRSIALVNPIQWPEPFGLVMIEALACGTPVITSPCGAAPEIVEHGKTGLFVRDRTELERAIMTIRSIDRPDCRRAVEQRFTSDRMVRDHVRFYRSVLARSLDGVRGVGQSS